MHATCSPVTTFVGARFAVVCCCCFVVVVVVGVVRGGVGGCVARRANTGAAQNSNRSRRRRRWARGPRCRPHASGGPRRAARMCHHRPPGSDSALAGSDSALAGHLPGSNASDKAHRSTITMHFPVAAQCTSRLFYGCSYMFHLSGDNSPSRGTARSTSQRATGGGKLSTESRAQPNQSIKIFRNLVSV